MQNISPQEAFDKLSHDSKAALVDVRTKEEWMDGIADMQSLRLVTILPDSEEFIRNLEDKVFDKDSEILFICKSGARSAAAAAMAEKFGYKNCYNVSGGFMEWQNSNLPSKAWGGK